MTNYSTYHVIFTLFGIAPVWDHNGNWYWLKSKYDELGAEDIVFELEKSFPKSYKGNNIATIDGFSEEQKVFLEKSIIELTKVNGDRICGDLKVQYLNIQSRYVELIVCEDASLVLQKLARLKSRTATLLSFEYPDHFNGKHTWSKGIWKALIKSDENHAIRILSAK